MHSKAERRAKFEDVYAVIRDELLRHFAGEGMPEEAREWYRNNLNYNVPGGKLNRGMSVVDTVEIIKQRELSADEYFKAAVLGWCVELLQAYFLIADDIMDHSLTRRGQPCWYRQPHVGMIAVNDAFMVSSAIYWLIKRYFKSGSGAIGETPISLETYIAVVELFHETTYQTEMGQAVDLITAPEGNVDLSKFSLERHALIVQYKTAYYSFYLPVALAMRLCGIPDTGMPTPYATALSILLPLGTYFQTQDDFLDFSAPPEILGKVGTDIVDNKCSWVINIAYARANEAQRRVLEENYGRGQVAGIEEGRVREVFEAVGVRDAYKAYEEEAVRSLKAMIGQVQEKDGGLRKEVFQSFLEKIYNRSK